MKRVTLANEGLRSASHFGKVVLELWDKCRIGNTKMPLTDFSDGISYRWGILEIETMRGDG